MRIMRLAQLDVYKRQDKYLLVDGEANVLEILDEQPEQQYPVVSGITINSVSYTHLATGCRTLPAFKYARAGFRYYP